MAAPLAPLCFGRFKLDYGTRQLTSATGEIHLSPKAFDLLAMLAAERPAAISKTTLQQRLWPDTFVAEANLSNLIAEIRQALEDSAREPKYLRTVHRFGYAFCGEASPARSAPRGGIASCWIEAGGQRFPLQPGEHVIGRDADAAIRIDASTVSRRHARIIVSAEGAVLEDFGSKNGTFRGAERVTSAVPLRNGDDIRLGSQLITYHTRDFDSTETQVEPPA
jgi:DNA-binding winged helix-turn-helix (wHTH) protein